MTTESSGVIERGNRVIIYPPVRRFDLLSRVLGGLAVLLGAVASLAYARAGLSLSHYDAKAHLVVARRILDSITPGWEQIGAVWLPLPHLLNMLPVQMDAFYQTGASAIAFSVLSLGLGAACIAATIVRLTGSRSGAAGLGRPVRVQPQRALPARARR